MRARGHTTSEYLTIDDLAGLFGRFEEDLRQTIFVRDVAAASSAGLDVDDIARAYLDASTTAGGAEWGALYVVNHDRAELRGVVAQTADPPGFDEEIDTAAVCDSSASVKSGTTAASPPPGLNEVGGAGAHSWVASEIRFGRECLAASVLGFISEERVPHDSTLRDAHTRLAAALHNARLFEAQSRSAELGRLLDDADVRMLASATPDDVWSVTVQTLEEALGAREVVLTLPDETTPTTSAARIGVELKVDRLAISFRVRERPGSMHLRLPKKRRGLDTMEQDFVTRLLSTTALAVEAQLLQREREGLMRAREEWVADLSHDIRTPLASIRGYAELLATGTGVDEQEVRREAGLIARQATAIERLVEDLHTAFRLRGNSLPVSLVSVDLTPIAEEALEIAIWHAGRGRIHVPFEHPAHPVFARVDPLHFSRIVTNLAANAFVHNTPETKVWASLACDGTDAHLTVADDGCGMDSKLAQRVLRRGERGPDRTAPGSGLGMAIVHELASDIGARVRIDSAQGSGTAVTVSVELDPSRDSDCG